MLDSSRRFWRTSEIKRLIDLMALHKLNVFHWHLTDDQGWRIEIDKYPMLTQRARTAAVATEKQMTAKDIIPRSRYAIL